ncbi:HPP family protein [Candidatus Pelagibacter sp.]|nr:HPP family protein [Candidatus Pelagibacter sp.]|tara:strand:+ start:57 stop:542 length:486 start_codon:yes stop_codon:yes gene_type:complete
MINIIKKNLKRAIQAFIFSVITIGTISYLSFETPYGLFLAGSFGSSMVLLFGYPESPFAQPKNVFFGHFITSLVGVIVFQFVPLDQYIQIALSVALGIFLMIILDVTHPPAGGNPIIVILAASSYDFLLNPIILGSLIIIMYAILLNRFILKKNYPSNWKS